LAAKLHGLISCASTMRVADIFGPLTEAQTALDTLIKGDPLPIETSKADATRLLNKLGNIFDRTFIDTTSGQIKKPSGEDRMDTHEIASIQSLVDKFEHALAAELNCAPVYFASRRGIYSTYDLIENAYQTFSESVLKIIPVTAQNEFGTAGRALAFGLGTATTMHLLRAVEVVLKQYYELFSGTTVAKTERSYNIYLKKLATLADDENNAMRPDKRLLQMLAQIKEHYRNPLTMPEHNVSVEQATSLFGLATAIITLMAEQIIARQKPASGKGGKAAKEALANVAEEADEGDEDDSFSFKTAKQG
jgi:hypothetical protein